MEIFVDTSGSSWYYHSHYFGDTKSYRHALGWWFRCDPGKVTIGWNGVSISILIKQTIVRLAIHVLRGLAATGKGLLLLLRVTLLKPLGWISRGVFRLLLLPFYMRYVRIKQKIKFHPRLAGIRSVTQFSYRYAVHLGLIALGIFGLTTNLLARTVRPDEIGQGAPWNSFFQGDSELIVETGAGQTGRSNVALAAVGGPELFVSAPVADSTVANPTSDAAPAVGGASQVVTERRTVETYTVEGGDTVSTIAEQFGISSRTVLWANGLSDTDFIKPGQVLKIPSVSGYLYTVKSGDTVSSIASRYQGREDEILATNNVPLAEAIEVGQEIIIPGGEPPAPPAPPPQRTFLAGVFSRSDNPPPSAPASGARFIWPTVGHRINQYFRGRWHTGIDIDGETTTPIYAAASGTVTYAAYSRNGYGLHVIIDHGNGYSTLYSHDSKVFVSPGQRVSQGQTIAMQGCTGRCSGTHVHFEIRSRGVPLNPLSFF
ncbi:MAG: peptidoglycan DD-metalloendopeptidase family protein [Candidatus Kerfeldbacteria bacterium]|nr:peptidoglycan DD-metalloendopeptidase family protein [Candidatus Kerfeldbacteria bacterium]